MKDNTRFREPIAMIHIFCFLITMVNDGIYGPSGRMLNFHKRNLAHNLPSILEIMLDFPKWV